MSKVPACPSICSATHSLHEGRWTYIYFSLLQAYSLFRLQKFEEALAAVQQNPEDRAVARLNLQAQLHYRMGGSSEAIRIYHQLFKDHKVWPLQTI